jgi:hypothetical protein
MQAVLVLFLRELLLQLAQSPGNRRCACRLTIVMGRRRTVAISAARDRDFDAAVLQGLLADDVAFLASFQSRSLDRVGLQEAVEVLLLAPGSAEVVVLDRAR